MSYPIICLAGQGGVGKDTVADLIKKNSPGTAQMALADELKDNLCKLGIPMKYLYGKSENRAITLNPNLLKGFFNSDLGSLISAGEFKNEAKLLKDFCARTLLQLLGSKVRNIDEDYWINTVYKKAKYFLNNYAHVNTVVISDLRFRNEILFFKSIGAKIYLVESPQGTLVKGKKAKDKSETELATVPRSWYDNVITNDKGLDKKDLKQQLIWSGLIDYKK